MKPSFLLPEINAHRQRKAVCVFRLGSFCVSVTCVYCQICFIIIQDIMSYVFHHIALRDSDKFITSVYIMPFQKQFSSYTILQD